jgi:glycosyltransferase involved in cell wall biosynthesis
VTRPRLSVVICTRNGADKLSTPLDSLEHQTVSDSEFEVIVVDDGSTDQTSAVAERHGVRVVRLADNAGVGAARNAGVSAALAPLVAFTDDDCEAAPTWIAELVAAFEDPRVDAVGGRVIPEAPSGFTREFLRANNPLVPLESRVLESRKPGDRLRRYLRRGLMGNSEPATVVYSVVGANMAFRRHVVIDAGGFDEAFRFASEEEDMCIRLHRRPGGACIGYSDSACITHWFESSVLDARLIIYPFPVALAITLAVALRFRRRSVPAVAALPWLLFPRWASNLRSERSLWPLAYPPLQLAQELYSMYGEAEGLRAGYRPLPASHLRPSAASVE